MSAPLSIGIIGARGHVGAQLLALIAGHPELELSFASSRAKAGEPVAAFAGQIYENLSPQEAAKRGADLVFLALPNGHAARWVEAIEAVSPKTRLIDISADMRFEQSWAYGLPELNREAIKGARRIANPGCYASAAQLAIAPLAKLLAAPPVIFGVSGYSGAGATPGPRNDPAQLADNLLPYGLTGHGHEAEISHRLDRPVHFIPHVAAFFRGLSVSVDMRLAEPLAESALRSRYEEFYAGEAFVKLVDEAPQVRQVAGTHGARIGGFALGDGGRRVVMVAVLDNLLKGAASQAVQNLNLAFGLEEDTGLAP